MERIPYTDFEGGFNQVVLEESFVMNLKTTMSFVDFHMNFAVNTNYPLYVAPDVPTSGDDVEEEVDTAYDENTGEEYEIPEGFMKRDDDAEKSSTGEPDIRYPYRRGRIFFPNMEQVSWKSRIQPYIDPSSGSVDYGSIDYFYKGDDGRYYLAGYWGELEIASGPPLLEIDELKEHNQAQYEKQKQQGKQGQQTAAGGQQGQKPSHQ